MKQITRWAMLAIIDVLILVLGIAEYICFGTLYVVIIYVVVDALCALTMIAYLLLKKTLTNVKVEK